MDEDLVCEMCGNDLAVENWRLCLDCIETLDDDADEYRIQPA